MTSESFRETGDSNSAHKLKDVISKDSNGMSTGGDDAPQTPSIGESNIASFSDISISSPHSQDGDRIEILETPQSVSSSYSKTSPGIAPTDDKISTSRSHEDMQLSMYGDSSHDHVDTRNHVSSRNSEDIPQRLLHRFDLSQENHLIENHSLLNPSILPRTEALAKSLDSMDRRRKGTRESSRPSTPPDFSNFRDNTHEVSDAVANHMKTNLDVGFYVKNHQNRRTKETSPRIKMKSSDLQDVEDCTPAAKSKHTREDELRIPCGSQEKIASNHSIFTKSSIVPDPILPSQHLCNSIFANQRNAHPQNTHIPVWSSRVSQFLLSSAFHNITQCLPEAASALYNQPLEQLCNFRKSNDHFCGSILPSVLSPPYPCAAIFDYSTCGPQCQVAPLVENICLPKTSRTGCVLETNQLDCVSKAATIDQTSKSFFHECRPTSEDTIQIHQNFKRQKGRRGALKAKAARSKPKQFLQRKQVEDMFQTKPKRSVPQHQNTCLNTAGGFQEALPSSFSASADGHRAAQRGSAKRALSSDEDSKMKNSKRHNKTRASFLISDILETASRPASREREMREQSPSFREDGFQSTEREDANYGQIKTKSYLHDGDRNTHFPAPGSFFQKAALESNTMHNVITNATFKDNNVCDTIFAKKFQEPFRRHADHFIKRRRLYTQPRPRPLSMPFFKSQNQRKARTSFSDDQLKALEEHFNKHKYLSVQDRIHLAETLQLSDIQVKTWYQNRRTKWKRQTAVGLDLLKDGGNMAAVQQILETNSYWTTYHPHLTRMVARFQADEEPSEASPPSPGSASSLVIT